MRAITQFSVSLIVRYMAAADDRTVRACRALGTGACPDAAVQRYGCTDVDLHDHGLSAHVDRFAATACRRPSNCHGCCSSCPSLQFGARLNCADELLDRWVARGRRRAHSPCSARRRTARRSAGRYAELQRQANRIANVLVRDLGLVPGNRVLLRGANSPMLAACWFGVVKAGGIAVGTMPLLRARELTAIVDKAEITHALVDARLADEISLGAAARARR